MKRILSVWMALVAVSFFFMASSVSAQQLVAGRDYTVLETPIGTEDAAKIEVEEFFSYGCPHCNDLHPLFDKWAAKQPADVAIRKIPVGFSNPYWEILARLYYTLEALGQNKQLDSAVFNALHVKGLKLIDEKAITEWGVSQGLDAKKIADAYGSFGVVSKTKRADQLAQTAKIRGVPSIIVQGRYLVGGPNVRSHAELLAQADKVIAMVRAERKKSAK